MTTDPTPLTDDEWRAFQAIPDQGYSHRGWVDRKIAQRVRKAQAEAWTDCVSEASALGWLHAPAALDMLDRNPHETEDQT